MRGEMTVVVPDVDEDVEKRLRRLKYLDEELVV
jgi:hypothetical protein